MELTEKNTVADFVVKNIKTAHVFKKHGIDFCCGGGISLEKACSKKKLDLSQLIKELDAVDTVHENTLDYDQWELGFLIDYIVNVHHSYVREGIPMLSQYANKVAKVHGHHYQELIGINEIFHDVANELNDHMRKEEQILFPLIKQLIVVNKTSKTLETTQTFSVSNIIQVMEQEHDQAGGAFKDIRKLTNNYTLPESACNTFRALYSKLEEFEQDLHQHIHLENNILHPKAITLEATLRD